MGFFDKLKKKNAPSENDTKPKQQGDNFVGFALLSDNSWDKAQLIFDLKEEWGLDASENGEAKEDSLVFSVGTMMASIALMPTPVPHGEAELNAANNYMWPEAVETTKSHQAHLMVIVLGGFGPEQDILQKGELFVKLLHCCCKQKNILGIYSSGTVFEPNFYTAGADVMKNGSLPVLNWIWFGLYRREGGMCCYTYGMKQFGKDEMEVLDADAQPSDLRNFLLNLVLYVLQGDVVLKNGETIGFSADDIHSITRSEGVSLPETTLKISYAKQNP